MVLGDYLYVTSSPRLGSEKLLALDPATGKEVWSAGVGRNAWIESLDQGAVYVSSGGTSHLALDAASGKKIWKFKTSFFGKQGGGFAAPPARDGDRLYFATETSLTWGEEPILGHLYGVDARTGKL